MDNRGVLLGWKFSLLVGASLAVDYTQMFEEQKNRFETFQETNGVFKTCSVTFDL